MSKNYEQERKKYIYMVAKHKKRGEKKNNKKNEENNLQKKYNY